MAFDNKSALNHAIRYLTQVAERRAAGGWLPPKERERQQRDAMRQEQQQTRQFEKQQQAQQKQLITDEKERQKNLEKFNPIRDENGKPKVFYHGTHGKSLDVDPEHERFGKPRDIKQFDTGSGQMGSHFGTIEQSSEFHGKWGGEYAPHAQTYPVHLSIKNPIRLTDHGSFDSDQVATELQALGHDKKYITKNGGFPKSEEEIKDYLKSLGYDGIVYLNRREGMGPDVDPIDLDNFNHLSDEQFKKQFPQAQDSYIAFDPHQIKSAIGNQGTFDPSNPDITKSEGGLILSKQYPTHYMPNVGRQVMANGGITGNGDHPRWIPTRLPKIEKNRAPNQIVDYETARNAPGGYFAKNMAHIRDYVNIPKNIAQNATDDELAEHFINHIKDNLLDLHDSIPPEIRERSKKWYDGARAITDRWSKQYNLPDHSVAGVLAALSPQMDWFKNVSLANRVLDIMSNHHDKPFDDQMLSKFGELTELAKKPEYTALAQMLHGKSLTDIDNLGLPEKERVAAKALWLRTHDETYGDRRHQIVTPEGDLGDYVTSASGAPKGTGWGSFNEIGKAIKAIELKDDPDGISPLMGMKHKVRNFYNNILAPNSTKGDVTIDTHAVAAGLYRPLSGNSLEVAHNLGTSPPAGMKGAADSATVGLSGTYPIFAEAYRRAAAERNILPRQMQSITWEAIRSLYPDTFKRGKKIQDIDDIWTQHKNGLIDQSQAREMAREIALGKGNSIPPPSWFGGGILGGASGSNAPVENTGEQGILSGLGVSGQQAGEVDARGRDGFAAGVPQEGQVKFARGGQTRSRHPALSIAGTHIREEEHGEPIFTGRL